MMGNSAFYQQMLPYAVKASAGTGVPVSVILAQWGIETQDGTSAVFKNDTNAAGIMRVGSSIAVGTSPSGYAMYNSFDQFVQDYIRVMGLSYYDAVRKAGGAQAAAAALQASPWSSGHYGQAGALWNIITSNNLTKYDNSGSLVNLTNVNNSLAGMSQDEIMKMAAIGAVVVAAAAILGK